MRKSLFSVPKMDCPSEEQMIRMALSKYKSPHFTFDLAKRQVLITHDESTDQIAADLEKLGLGSNLLTDEIASGETSRVQEISEGSVLKKLLAINFFMFVVEIGIGFYAQSTGLIADSFDMLADSIVYGMSLYAVGRSLSLQSKSAKLSGYFQLLLALGAFTEVIRRFIFGSDPNSTLMIAVSVVALLANVSCMLLLMKHRQGAIHMRASWIFSTNDVIANTGVIIAGVLVYLFKTPWPDLVVGIVITAIVARGALSILKLSSPREARD
jgi:Co/Zn/Cd efflux system component